MRVEVVVKFEMEIETQEAAYTMEVHDKVHGELSKWLSGYELIESNIKE